MRPLKLTMSAFGSYGGLQEVDFEKIENGIFLITGDTGAGKTTIFDAISFALFGETSGQKRDGSMMRSQYAREEEETIVSLKFSERGEVYEVTRSPSYARLSRRKNKNGEYTAVAVSAKASLILPGGMEYPGNIRDINQKIQDIIGVDQNQFSQIAMIAQGDYLKLLHASSKERKEIFSKIFNTGIYSRIQLKLKEKDLLLWGQLEDGRKLAAHELMNLQLPEDSKYQAEWQELMEYKETKTEEIQKLFDQITEEIRQQEDEAAKKQETVTGALLETERQISVSEEVNRLFDSLEQAKNALVKLEDKKEEWEALKIRLKRAGLADQASVPESRYLMKKKELQSSEKRKNQLEYELELLQKAFAKAKKDSDYIKERSEKEMPGILTGISRLDAAMPVYRKWEDAWKLFSERKKEEEETGREYLKIERDWNHLKKVSSDNESEQERIKGRAESLSDVRQKHEEGKRRQEAMGNLLEAVTVHEAELEKKEKLQVMAELAGQEYEAAEQDYNQKFKIFLTMQAGIMAERLKEGDPCPVCGSLNHPKKAHLSEGAVTQNMVEQARERRNKAERSCQEAANFLIASKEKCSHQEKQIEKEGEIWLGKLNISSDLRGRLEKEKRESEALNLRTGKELEEAQKAELRLKELQESQKEIRLQLSELEVKKEEIQKHLQDKKVNAASSFAEAEQIKKALPYEKEEDALEERGRLEADKAALIKAGAQAEETFGKLLEEEKEKKGRLASEKENLESDFHFLEEAQATFYQSLKSLGFSGTEDYEEAKKPREVVEKWEKEISSYEAERLRLKTITTQLTEQTQGRTRIDTGLLKERAGEFRKEQDLLERKKGRISALLSRACQTGINLNEIWAKKRVLEETYRVYHSLYQTANGKMSKMVSLDFQTFVQRQYFNQMIHAANKRLKIMTDGRFLLQCREMDSLGKQGEVGLDLDVYSVITGKVRDVKSLSGGESFMAALSMALGMADVIQSTAGNVCMDALFIDEGFGSLDEDSRLKAVTILRELAAGRRIIGIISHVTELKEQIGKKLLVKKTEKGSSLNWEIEGIYEEIPD